MRRVVAEQIKALNELTEIVARSGRAFDVAEPASLIQPTRPPDPPAPRRPEPRAAEQPRAVEPARASEPAPHPEPAAREMPTRPRPATRSPQIARAEERAPAQAQDRSHGGWLTDLLARASREEGEESTPPQEPARQAPNRAIDSIDALSLDIARLLDHDAVVDLWDRYRRGERHVFSRRLYTAQGQQAFEEIRRRYQSDGTFRETVDRYIQEFERLLTEVSREDPDNPLAKSYLTSETGKVYTMLTHAAARFE
jgi:hypothetical protein